MKAIEQISDEVSDKLLSVILKQFEETKLKTMKTKPTKVSDQKLPRIEKTKRGGSRPNAGRREKVYSETLIEKKLLIPQSKYQYFTDLAKSEREKVFLHYVDKN